MDGKKLHHKIENMQTSMQKYLQKKKYCLKTITTYLKIGEWLLLVEL